MKLSDYPTPLTDAHYCDARATARNERNYNHARDLERKLAKCRELLDSTSGFFDSITKYNRTGDRIRATLDQTK